MASIRSLFKDTAIYGVSSIVGRFLNWLLVPMYTYCFPKAEYGIVTNIYAYVAMALIILTYGMETGFFRFANHKRWTDPLQVYATTLTSIGCSSLLFLVAGVLLSPEIARWLDCADHPSFIWMMVATVAIDAFTSIPFAFLRYNHRPIRFATLKLVNIGLNIALNLFFILVCPALWRDHPGLISWFYNPDFGIGYIFLANFMCSLLLLLLLIPDLLPAIGHRFNAKLWREMLRYSYPLLIIGMAGIMNQTIDKILYPILIKDPEVAYSGLGIYGANYKIAIVMVMFIQAFRFAYEPFIFAQSKQQGEDPRQSYATAMRWFVIMSLAIFLGVMFFLPIIKYFIAPDYFSGLRVVPIVMAAELFFGIFFNLSVWYKLTDRTTWGTWFSLLGLAVTLAINILGVPVYGYMACAWAAFCCYGTMMVTCYAIGRRYYPVPYQLGRMGGYALLALLLWVVASVTETGVALLDYAVRLLLLAIYAAAVYLFEFRRARFRTIKH